MQQNVEFEVQGDQLVITVDLSQELGVSVVGSRSSSRQPVAMWRCLGGRMSRWG